MLDNALLLQAIAGADGIDDRQQAGCPFPAGVPDYPALARTGAKGLRVGLLVEGFNHPGGHDPRVSALVKRAAEQLLSLGAASVTDVSVPMHLDANILWGTIGRLGGAGSLLGQNGGRRGLALNDLADKMAPVRQEAFGHLFPSTKNSFINALWAAEHMPASLVGKATNLVRKLKDEYLRALGQVDVLLMPTIPFLPKPMVAAATSTPAQLMANASGYTRNTSAFVSWACGRVRDELACRAQQQQLWKRARPLTHARHRTSRASRHSRFPSGFCRPTTKRASPCLWACRSWAGRTTKRCSIASGMRGSRRSTGSRLHDVEQSS